MEYHDHPDRVNYPMKRVGKRGEGKWQQITWDEALDEIAAKLAAIRNRHGPHYGLWESKINAILPDGEEFCDYAGDNYMRALICRLVKA